MKTRQNACDTPSAILSRKGIARYGVSDTGPLREVVQVGSKVSETWWENCTSDPACARTVLGPATLVLDPLLMVLDLSGLHKPTERHNTSNLKCAIHAESLVHKVQAQLPVC